MPLLIDKTGVAIQTQAEIADERAGAIRVATGLPTLQFTGDTILGQINSAESDREASIQEQFAVAVQASNVLTASGAQLDGLVPIGGELAKPATHSAMAGVQLGGTAASVVPIGVLLGIPGLSPRFAIDATVTLAAAAAWAIGTAYAIGAVRKANSQVWYCIVDGMSAAAGAGPSGSSLGLIYVDNTVAWIRIATGDGYTSTTAHAVDTGPVACAQYGLTLIVTPIAGLAGCVNVAAAIPGVNAETDAALRLRYSKSFHAAGNCTVDAVFAHLNALAGVSDLAVYQNRTGLPDATKGGMPGHSIWAIVDGTATDAEIAKVLYDSIAGGIQIGWSGAPAPLKTYAYTNSQGTVETLYWSTPGTTLVDVVITLPASMVGMTALLSAATGPVYSYFATLTIGSEGSWWRVVCAVGDALRAVGVDPATLVVTLNGVAGNIAGVYNNKLAVNSITVVPA